MTEQQIKRKEVLDYAISIGWKCNPDTGEVFSHTGKLIIKNNSIGYIHCNIKINKKVEKFFAHHFIYYISTGNIGNIIDHLNGIRDDNRICNLQNGTLSDNQQNRKNTRGYCFDKQMNKWKTQIVTDNKVIHLGYYDTEIEARQAYLDAKKIHHPKKAELFI
jgi:hypothetical protein